jgi:hypothetical protein
MGYQTSPPITKLLTVKVLLFIATLLFVTVTALLVVQAGELQSPLREKLTSATWQFVRGEGPFAEGYKYDFFADRSFRWRVVSDYAEERKGSWIEQTISNDEGLLFLLWEDNTQSVLYFTTLGGTMRLAGDVLQPVKRSGETTSGSRKTIQNTQTTFRSYFSITSRPWHKIDAADRDFVPDHYTFKRDGTFLASYRAGQCQHSGHWSMIRDSIVLEVPSNRCDLRGPRESSNWHQEFNIENDRLTLDRNIYASSDH